MLGEKPIHSRLTRLSLITGGSSPAVELSISTIIPFQHFSGSG
jgi:hypothetical protein